MYKLRHVQIFVILLLLSLGGCTNTQDSRPKLSHSLSAEISTVKKWHTVTLSFQGPNTSETAKDNPFLNYRLLVEFRHKKTKKVIRGFYAADGNAAHTSSDSGSVWRVRFTPDQVGLWSYKASLQYGDTIALSDDAIAGKNINIANHQGFFHVMASDKRGDDFRAKGRLGIADGYFKFNDEGPYWLKTGTNSPENLLGYVDFDNTYRIKAEAREGEASAPKEIHSYQAHATDWKPGDPTWKKGKGKTLIGAINYLASKGMNAAYFLTLNVLGDGKDVWPYRQPHEFTRFDVSKLEQWEIVFSHMQAKGILLHLVVQETENEIMLDNGDTGLMRQLYFRELIARFGHHLALVWNLGEENGPAPWITTGQNDKQRKAMTKFLKQNDPYQHPVLLHTHAEDPLRSDILNDILGFSALDGLSLQQAEREHAGAVVETWKNKSSHANHKWLITMDEIGKWHTGALTDAQDPNHKSLRSDVLWGTLLSGAAGVEWYFGAKHPHNDLTSEDWRLRDQLWQITHHARVFFDSHLPYWQMQACHNLVNSEKAYCLGDENNIYAVYLPDSTLPNDYLADGSASYTLDLRSAKDQVFHIQWYNPLTGGQLAEGSIKHIRGGKLQSLGKPPSSSHSLADQDWVVLIKKQP